MPVILYANIPCLSVPFLNFGKSCLSAPLKEPRCKMPAFLDRWFWLCDICQQTTAQSVINVRILNNIQAFAHDFIRVNPVSFRSRRNFSKSLPTLPKEPTC